MQIVKGLTDLRKENLVHRDLKPANIVIHFPDLLNEDLTEYIKNFNFENQKFCCKIADFGLAKTLGEDSFAETYCGSNYYIAPEIVTK